MKASKIEFDLGPNCHKQRVRLVYEKTTSGGYAWTLHRDQGDQRDDKAVIGGLTDDQLAMIGDAVNARRGMV